MKPNTIVMSALAAGLVAFAADKVQAGGIVIENTLFVPMTVKLTVSYMDGIKVKTAKVTSKEILAQFDAPKGATLAVFDGDVFIVTKTEVGPNLSEEGNLFINLNRLDSGEVDGTNGQFKYAEVGLGELKFLSDGDPDLIDNQYSFDVTGQYTENEQRSATDNSGNFKMSIKFSSKAFSGPGYDHDVTDSELPVTGSLKGNGSGKLQTAG